MLVCVCLGAMLACLAFVVTGMWSHLRCDPRKIAKGVREAVAGTAWALARDCTRRRFLQVSDAEGVPHLNTSQFIRFNKCSEKLVPQQM